jgi:hypothetical protein
MLNFRYALLALAASPCCVAQETAPATETAALAQSQDTSSACCRIADGTAVTIEILEPLNSALLKRGDKFRLRLAETVLVESQPVLASGLEGVGEIVHAEKSRSGGKAGELLIAARYLETSGTQVPLRGLKVGGRGKDNTNAAMATSFAVGPFALFVRGREIVIPAGTLAQAKIAKELHLPAQPGTQTPAPAAHVAESATSALGESTASASTTPSMPAESVPDAMTAQSTTTESTQEPKE